MRLTAPESRSGFVLAGGLSSRMGTVKARALFAGVPMIQIALDRLLEAGVVARIAGSRVPLAEFAEQIADRYPDAGPLGGVETALSATESEWNLFVPVDQPLMPASLLRCLLERAQLTGAPVTATRLNGRIEPFPVVLSRSVLAAVRERIEAGETACHRAWQGIPEELGAVVDAPDVEALAQCGQCRDAEHLPPVLWYQNANTPQELARLNCIQARVGGNVSSIAKVPPLRAGLR